MDKFWLRMVETLLAWYFDIKILLTYVFKINHNKLKGVCIYGTFMVYLVENDITINHEQWLEANTSVPLIGVSELPIANYHEFGNEHFNEMTNPPCPVYERIPKQERVPFNEMLRYVVMSNTAFHTALTVEEQDALLEHEIAHIVHGDVQTHVENTLDISKELLADFQVAAQGKGDYLVAALSKIKNSIPDKPWRRKAIRAIGFRIQYLRNHSIPLYEDQLKAKQEIEEFVKQEAY